MAGNPSRHRCWRWRKRAPSSTACPWYRSFTGCSASRYWLRLRRKLWERRYCRPREPVLRLPRPEMRRGFLREPGLGPELAGQRPLGWRLLGTLPEPLEQLPGQGEELPGQPLPGEPVLPEQPLPGQPPREPEPPGQLLPREPEPPGQLLPREPVLPEQPLLGQPPRELEPPVLLPPPEPELLPPRELEPPEKPVLHFLARPLASKVLPLWRQPAWAWEPERRAAYMCIKTTRRLRLQRSRRSKEHRKRKRRKMPEAGKQKTKMRELRMESWGPPGCPQRSAKF